MSEKYTLGDGELLKDVVDDPSDIDAEDRLEAIDHGPVAERQADLVAEVPGEDVTDEMLRNDVDRADSWLHYQKGLGQTGFSPGHRITPDTLDSLEHQWTFETEAVGLEANPVVVPGDPPVMYFSTTTQSVHAVNARTGERYWTYSYDASSGANRGVAVWKDKVYLGASNVSLVALDRYTGELQWEQNWYSPEQRSEMGAWREQAIGHTAAPIVYDGRVYLGQSGDSGAWTVMSALDAETGEILWQTNTAPRDEWVGETWRYSSAAPWMGATVDPETDTVLFPVANPTPQHGVTDRPGPNKHSNSVVALDATTGETKWANQLLAHEVWDYDIGTTLSVFDVTVGDESRRAVLADAKVGWSYLIDVETGDLLERSRPWEGVRQDHWGEGFLTLPPLANYPQQQSSQAENREVMWPSAGGGKNWPPSAYSPRTGLRYMGVTTSASTIYHYPDWEYDPERDSQVTLRAGNHTYIPPTRLGEFSDGMYDGDVYTTGVLAVDPATGENVWYRETNSFSASDASAWSTFPGGTAVTAGNVVFAGAPDGDLLGLDAETGELLGKANTGLRITPSPVIWDDPVRGMQFVSVASNDSIVTYGVEASTEN